MKLLQSLFFYFATFFIINFIEHNLIFFDLAAPQLTLVAFGYYCTYSSSLRLPLILAFISFCGFETQGLQVYLFTYLTLFLAATAIKTLVSTSRLNHFFILSSTFIMCKPILFLFFSHAFEQIPLKGFYPLQWSTEIVLSLTLSPIVLIVLSQVDFLKGASLETKT